jgi:hypothetical protein
VDDFWGFYYPIYSAYARYIIYFTVPLCSCITGLGSEQPLLFCLLYSFVPTKKKKNKKQKKERELFLSTLRKGSVDKFIVSLCIFLVMSCKIAPPNS